MGKKAEPLMANGMTARQYEELKLRTLSNDVEKIPANRADRITDKLFAKDFDGYEIPQHERMHYHVAQELRLFSQADGGRQSVPSIHTYDKAMWPIIKNSDVFKAYTSEIIHNPEEEDEDAVLITLKYTLTDEELAASSSKKEKKGNKAKEEKDADPEDEDQNK